MLDQRPDAVEGAVMKKSNRPTAAFSKIRACLEDAIACHQGARKLTVREVDLEPPSPMKVKDTVTVRSRPRVSQAAFARILNVSPRTVQAWETSARERSDAALKLLEEVP
jgi:putative transcriptional regulator